MVRLRDLPGLAASAEKVYEQFKGYMGKLPTKRGTGGTPYTTAKRKRKRLKWD